MNRNEIANLHSTMIWMPSTVEDAVKQMSQLGTEACYLAGATLLQVQWEAGKTMPKHLINLEQIPLLKEVNIAENGDWLSIGSFTTLAECRHMSLLKKTYPVICDAVKYISAPAVRNRGTIGGNIMGGIGDLIPLLLVMEAKLVFLHTNGFEKIDLSKYLNNTGKYKQSLLLQVLIPKILENLNDYMFFSKIGRREAFTSAIVTVAGLITCTKSGIIERVKLAVGGGENKPLLLEKTEQLLTEKKREDVDWKEVYKAVCDEFNPVSDSFISGDYRKKVAANLIIARLQEKLSSKFNRKEHSDEF